MDFRFITWVANHVMAHRLNSYGRGVDVLPVGDPRNMRFRISALVTGNPDGRWVIRSYAQEEGRR